MADEADSIIMADDLAYSTGEAMVELRWEARLVKPVMPDNGFYWQAPPYTVEKVLQQRWFVRDYRGGKCIDLRHEWRDVPTATA